MSTNKLVCQLCAEFIPATRAAKQNHRLTVGQTSYSCSLYLLGDSCATRVLAAHRRGGNPRIRGEFVCRMFASWQDS